MIFNRKRKQKFVEEVKIEAASTSGWLSSTDVWNMCEYVTRTGYDFSSSVVNWIYKKMFDPQPPGDTLEWAAWNDRKIAERKQAQFETIRGERKKTLVDQYNKDREIIKDKKDRCTEWHSESKKQLDTKYYSDTNVFVPEQDWNNPSHTIGWETEQFDHTPNNQKLCERLDCDSNSKSKLPDIVSSSKNACRQEQLKIRDFEREMQRTEQAFDRLYNDLTEYYENTISEMMARCQSERSGPKRGSSILELPAPTTVPNPVSTTTALQLGGATGFWSILNFPVNLARGTIFELSKGQSFVTAPIFRMFEVLIALLVVVIYCIIAYLVWQMLSFGFEIAKESVQHWRDNRRRESEYLFDQRRREDNVKLRRKRRREFGRGLNEVLDGPAKKTATLIKTFRGGYQPLFANLSLPKIPFYALKIDPAEFTEWEKEQILFACDPIHSMIQIEKLRLEVREILESCQPSDLYKPQSIKVKKIFKSFSTPFKRISFRRLKAKVSSSLGVIVLIMIIFTSTVPTSDHNNNSRVSQSPGYPIEQTNTRYPDLTNTFKPGSSGLDLKQLEELVETEELLELEAAVENEKAETRNQNKNKNKNKNKGKKHNRKIHTLEDLEKEQGKIQAVYSVREDNDGRLHIERVEGNNVERLTIEKSISDKDKVK